MHILASEYEKENKMLINKHFTLLFLFSTVQKTGILFIVQFYSNAVFKLNSQ
jgi:hypothetical protein